MLRAIRATTTLRHGARSFSTKPSIATDAIDDLIKDSASKIENAPIPPGTPQITVTLTNTPTSPAEQGPPAAVLGFSKDKKIAPEKYLSVEIHRLYLKSTRNNTIATLTTPTGRIIYRTSGAQVGFKGANRASYECGLSCHWISLF